MDTQLLLDNIPQWALVAIPILAILFILYLISKLFESDKVRDKGIVGILVNWLETGLSVLTDEVSDFIAFLFGRSKDIAADSVNEAYFHKLTKPAIAIAVVLVTVSFAGSFNAVRSFAESNGIAPGVAFGIPIAVDGLILLSVLAILAFSFVGENIIWLKVVLLAATVASILFNVAHIKAEADSLTPGQILVATVFPTVILIGTEILSLQFKRKAIRQHLIKTNDELEQQTEMARQELAGLTAKIADKIADLRKRQAETEMVIQQAEPEPQQPKKAERSATETGNSTKELAYQFLANAHKEGWEPNGTDVADHVDRSPSLGRKLKRELWPVIVGGNGNGSTGNGGGNA